MTYLLKAYVYLYVHMMMEGRRIEAINPSAPISSSSQIVSSMKVGRMKARTAQPPAAQE
jgi:hypothetical protein